MNKSIKRKGLTLAMLLKVKRMVDAEPFPKNYFIALDPISERIIKAIQCRHKRTNKKNK